MVSLLANTFMYAEDGYTPGQALVAGVITALMMLPIVVVVSVIFDRVRAPRSPAQLRLLADMMREQGIELSDSDVADAADVDDLKRRALTHMRGRKGAGDAHAPPPAATPAKLLRCCRCGSDNEQKARCRLPAWMLAVAYVLSWAAIGLSAYYIGVWGLHFDAAIGRDWLQSILIQALQDALAFEVARVILISGATALSLGSAAALVVVEVVVFVLGSLA